MGNPRGGIKGMTVEEYPYELIHSDGCGKPMMYLKGIPIGNRLHPSIVILPSGRIPEYSELIICENCNEQVGPMALDLCYIKERSV